VTLTPRVRLHLDDEAFDYHMDVDEDATRYDIERAEGEAASLGFELVDEDEAPADLLENGTTMRYWLVPIIPVEV